MRPALLWPLALFFVAQAALAAPLTAEKRAAALVKEAEKLYTDGQYKEAAEILKKAHELDPDARLIYNIARAYDQAGDLAASLEYYRDYVSSEDIDPQLVKKANLAMDRLRALIAKEETTWQVQNSERKRLEEETRLAQERARAEEDKARRQNEEYEAQWRAEAEAKAKGQDRRKTIAYVSGGLAIAGLGAGAFFGLSARSARTAFAAAPDVDGKRALEADTRRNALIADVGFGVALAAAVGAVLAWPKGEDEEEAEEEVEGETDVSGVIVPAFGGVGVSVRF